MIPSNANSRVERSRKRLRTANGQAMTQAPIKPRPVRGVATALIYSLALGLQPIWGQTTTQWELEQAEHGKTPIANELNWQLVPEEKPATQVNIRWEPLPGKGDGQNPAEIRWEALGPDDQEDTPKDLGTSPAVETQKRADLPPNLKVFRSASRSITYGGMIYPEMGFWIPSVFRQDAQYPVTLTFQVLGNPTNTAVSDRCSSWSEQWTSCADSQYMAEATPLITGPVSLGVNYSQQESFWGSRNDGGWEQGGQALGFQIKSNLSKTIGLGIVGANLWNPYGKGGPNGRFPDPSEEIQADLGRAYLLLGSAAWDLGYWFNSEWPAILAVTAGAGNGRYKSVDDISKQWVNFGSLGPVATLGLAFNERFSVFAEYAGQYAGFGMSLKPVADWPVTGTLMFRDFQGAYQGKTNCYQGNPSNCRTTMDARLTIHF
jgi:hypothetical protein